MKRLILLLFLVAGLGVLSGARHSYALFVVGDGGGGGDPGSPYLSTRGPASNSLYRNPPQQYCNGGIGYNYPCNDTLGGHSSPYFVVGNNQVLDSAGHPTFPNSNISIRIYLKNSSNAVFITIYNEAGNCNDNSVTRPSNSVAPDYNNAQSGGPATNYSLQKSQFSIDNNPIITGSTACNKIGSFEIANPNKTFWLNSNHNDVNGSGYTHYVTLTAQTPPNSDTNKQGENSFYIVVSGDSRAGFGAGETGYGYRDVNICDFVDTTGGCSSNNNGNVFTQAVVFGVDKYCGDDLNASESASVSVADLDAEAPYSTWWNPHIHVWLQEESWAYLAQENSSNPDSSNWRDPNAKWQDVKELTQPDLANDTKTTTYQIGPGSYDPAYRYRLLLQNVGEVNTIYVKFNGPISQVSGVYHLTQNDCYKFSCTPTPVDVDPTKVTVRITNDTVNYPAGKGFYIVQSPDTQSWPGSLPNPVGFGSNLGANGGANQHDFTRPTANATETYTLYDDSGNEVDWDNGTCSTSSLTFSCTVTSGDAEPGQGVSKLYQVVVTAKGSGQAGNYTVQLSTSGGANITGSNTGIVNINADNPGSNGVQYPAVTFDGYINYGGANNITAAITKDPSGNPINPAPTCNGSGTPYTRPYFVVRGGDISTGGGFKDVYDNCDSSGGPPYITPNSTDLDLGGILAFSSPTSRGSSADFGVDALGEIYKSPDPTKYMGFYSKAGALFANTNQPSTSYGGFLDSDNPLAYCEPDFFDNTRSGTPQTLSSSTLNATNLTGQWQYTAGTLTISSPGNPSVINPGMRPTIYVDGNVTINGDIINATTWDPTDFTNVPFLTVIANGNITLTSNVKQIDGLFIAQPKKQDDGSYAGGQFNTCDSSSFCAGQLTVNGAVIAQQINLLRAHGTLCGSGSCVDPYHITTYPAEIFNYSPAMVVGKPNFRQEQSLNGVLESLISLPPVF